MDVGSVIPFPGGGAAALQAQAAAQAAVAASQPVQQVRPEPKKPGECTDCVDSRERPLLDQRSLLVAQEAAGQARQLERAAAQAEGEEAGQQAAQRSNQPSSDQLGELTEAEQKQVAELKKADAEIRRHEQAHASVGGQYAGSPSYEYTTGPDGKRYATAGQVPIDVAPIPNDPKATAEKMEVVRRAALAPAEPSPEDRAIAAKASQEQARARAELASQKADELANPGAADGGDPAEQTASAVAGQAAVGQSTPASPSGRSERPVQTVDLGSLFGITA